MASVGRNQPCPCGSGKRYKDCHGALAAVGTTEAAANPPELAWVPQVMDAALRAQKAGRPREAAESYRRVLAADPLNFDALHMLGLTEYEEGREDSALALLRRAIELRPDISRVRKNLHLLEWLPMIEDEVGRDVLPRLLSRIEPVADLRQFAGAVQQVQVVCADDRGERVRPIVNRLAQAFGNIRHTLWIEPDLPYAIAGARVLDAGAGARPDGGLVVLCGTARSPAAWLGAARSEKVLLVVLADEPCAVIDRIDEIAACDKQAGVTCATSTLAARLRLPRDAVVPETEPMAVADT